MAVVDPSVGQITLRELSDNLARVIEGKRECLDTLVITLAAGGSVLLEDVPGVGKTTLAKAVAVSIGATYHRIQFTPDLLPADITGSSIYNPAQGTFEFREGPIFCNVLLADEINRASPRTQSALLEPMNERQVSVEGETRELPRPFFILATQNPIEYHGTYPLPEAQLDRFMAVLDIGYPSAEDEVHILQGQMGPHPLESLQASTSKEALMEIQDTVRLVHVDESVTRYVVEISRRSREHPQVKLGVSPRGSLMLFRASQACAFMDGRDYVSPDDVQRLAVPVLAHRLILHSKAKYGGVRKETLVSEIVTSIPVPI